MTPWATRASGAGWRGAPDSCRSRRPTRTGGGPLELEVPHDEDRLLPTASDRGPRDRADPPPAHAVAAAGTRDRSCERRPDRRWGPVRVSTGDYKLLATVDRQSLQESPGGSNRLPQASAPRRCRPAPRCLSTTRYRTSHNLLTRQRRSLREPPPRLVLLTSPLLAVQTEARSGVVTQRTLPADRGSCRPTVRTCSVVFRCRLLTSPIWRE